MVRNPNSTSIRDARMKVDRYLAHFSVTEPMYLADTESVLWVTVITEKVHNHMLQPPPCRSERDHIWDGLVQDAWREACSRLNIDKTGCTNYDDMNIAKQAAEVIVSEITTRDK